MTTDLFEATQEVIEGTFARTIFRNEQSGYTVFHVDVPEQGTVTVVGEVAQSLTEHQTVKLVGDFTDHPKFGRQFKLTSLEVLRPTTVQGIVDYLGSGWISGVGPALAQRIVDRFGEKTLEVLDIGAPSMSVVPGIGDELSRRITEAWKANREEAQEIATLCGLSLSVNQAMKARRLWGKDAIKTVQDNPYALTEIHGIGFLKADAIAQALGVSGEHPMRVNAGIEFALEQSGLAGHCYLPQDELIKNALGYLRVDHASVEEGLDRLQQDRRLIHTKDLWYRPSLFHAERQIEEAFRELTRREPLPRTALNPRAHFLLSTLEGDQQTAAVRALTDPLSVITGLPGTGKTFTVKTIAEASKELSQTVILAAPTGKAARRLEEVTGFEASTIHRALEFNPAFGPARNKENPLDADLVIIDESSMPDTYLMAKLVDAIDLTRTRLVMVGDVNQLPSIGPGQILRDLIASKICPVTHLTKIHRQAEGSPIVKLAHAIHHGETELSSCPSEGLEVFPVKDAEEAEAMVLSIVRALSETLSDFQIILPRRAKCSLSSHELNPKIRNLVNPSSNSGNSIEFRVRDRLIQMANNYELEVMNGEVGIAQWIEGEGAERKIEVAFDAKDILYDKDSIDQLEFAYALTIHKVQGSEFDTVILVLHTQHWIMLRRELLYTGITRAKERLIIITSPRAWRQAVTCDETQRRYTGLLK